MPRVVVLFQKILFSLNKMWGLGYQDSILRETNFICDVWYKTKSSLMQLSLTAGFGEETLSSLWSDEFSTGEHRNGVEFHPGWAMLLCGNLIMKKTTQQLSVCKWDEKRFEQGCRLVVMTMQAGSQVGGYVFMQFLTLLEL